MANFITMGEPLVVFASQDSDISLDKSLHFQKFLAGAELNVAIGMHRLGHETMYVSKVGDDILGKFIVDSIKEIGLDSSNLLIDNQFFTGFYFKQKVSKGDPKVYYYRKDSAASNIHSKEIDPSKIKEVKVAHLTGIMAALSETSLQTLKDFNEELNAHQILTIFDPNLRPALWESTEKMINVTNDLARNSAIVLPGINEGKILMGSSDPEKIADFYLNQSKLTHTVIVKLGAEGAFVKLQSGENYYVPGFKVQEVVDTVGAGDGFAVGLESALLEGKPLNIAVHRACAIGALAVQSAGDSEGYPNREQLSEFYKRQNYQGDL